MNVGSVAVLGAAALVLAGCGSIAPEPLVLGPFIGVVACADCPGIATELTLIRRGEFVAEGTYQLKETFLDHGAPVVATGEWTTLRGDATDENAVVYELDPDKPQGARHFLKVGERELRVLDGDLRERPKTLASRLRWTK